MLRNLLTIILVVGSLQLKAQDLFSFVIPDSLSANADSVVRDDFIEIDIPTQREMRVTRSRTVTVLNKKGNGDVDAYLHYDPSTRIKNMRAVIYNSLGVEIETVKEKDFKDRSIADGVSIFNDTRLKYLEYTPTRFPYTVKFTYETITSNTAQMPRWFPVNTTGSSTAKSTISITYNSDLELRHKVVNVSKGIKITDQDGFFEAEATGMIALSREAMGPSFSEFAPHIVFSLTRFHYEGEDGEADNWKDFGAWVNEALLSDTTVLSPEVKTEIKALVAGETDIRARAKIVYEYMQNRTRYISVQMGVGGWKPMLASDVHSLGYGDCKGLSNYTRALLDAVDVPSNYILLYGGRKVKSLQTDFASMQGNHAILAVPYDSDYIWLECTSQEAPFGHIAGFTDNREVLVVKENGGEIVRTRGYAASDNVLTTNATLTLNPEGNIKGSTSLKGEGSRYDYYKSLEKPKEEKSREALVDHWSYINNLSVNNLQFNNDKEDVSFTITTDITIQKPLQHLNDEMILLANLLHRNTEVPARVKNREQSFNIERGYTDVDEVRVAIPTDMSMSFLPEPIKINSDFGTYTSEVVKSADGDAFTFKRTFIKKAGTYAPELYKKYRSFIKKVARADNQKIILKKS